MSKDAFDINDIKKAIEEDLKNCLKIIKPRTYSADEISYITSELRFKLLKDCHEVMSKYPGINIEGVTVDMNYKLNTELKTINIELKKPKPLGTTTIG